MLYLVLYCIVLYCNVLCIVLYCIALYCIVLYYVVYCIVLCIVLYCIMYCIVLAGTRGLRPLIAKNPHHLEPASPYNKSHRNLNIKVRPFKILFVTPLTRGLQSRFSLDSDTSSKSKNNLARLQLISRVFFCCLSML